MLLSQSTHVLEAGWHRWRGHLLPIVLAAGVNLALLTLIYQVAGQQFKAPELEEPPRIHFQVASQQLKPPPPPPPNELAEASPLQPSAPVVPIEAPSISPTAKIKLPLVDPNLKFDPSMAPMTLAAVAPAGLPEAKPLQQIAPRYPPKAQARGVEGEVVLKVLLGADGRPQQLEVIEENPAGYFASSTLRAVKRWSFAPPSGGQPQWQRVRVRYQLQ